MFLSSFRSLVFLPSVFSLICSCLHFLMSWPVTAPTKNNMIDATIISNDSRAGVTHVSLCIVLFPVNDSVTNHMTVLSATTCWHHNIIQNDLMPRWYIACWSKYYPNIPKQKVLGLGSSSGLQTATSAFSLKNWYTTNVWDSFVVFMLQWSA